MTRYEGKAEGVGEAIRIRGRDVVRVGCKTNLWWALFYKVFEMHSPKCVVSVRGLATRFDTYYFSICMHLSIDNKLAHPIT